jgi:hypothetical protein
MFTGIVAAVGRIQKIAVYGAFPLGSVATASEIKLLISES